ncbi:MAG: cell wall hydrolase [Lachnospiraceae bacterium]|jgi:spore germination cell wall hydrolase CwlJ-like protein|nr:cell wall hydrolase [Lachnospiraceae bacterium]
MKRIVTVIAACMMLSFMICFSTHAATKATTKENVTINHHNKTKKATKKKSRLTAQKSKLTLQTVASTEMSAQSVKKEVATAKKIIKKEEDKKIKYSKEELRYMTCIIYCEARGESYAGQKAVGIVVMNRKKDKDFPNTIKEVIYQRGQFSPARNGALSRALEKYDKYAKKDKFKGEMPSCLKAAKEVLEGSTTVRKDGKEKDLRNFLYFSRYLSHAKFTLGNHQFK